MSSESEHADFSDVQHLSDVKILNVDREGIQWIARFAREHNLLFEITPSSFTTVSQSRGMPPIVKYCYISHRMRNVKGKEECDAPTLIESSGEHHALYYFISQNAMCVGGSALGALTTHWEFCARISFAYHEPGVKFEGCLEPQDDCIHADIALYKTNGSPETACAECDHEPVDITSLTIEQRIKYSEALKEMESYVDSIRRHQIRGGKSTVSV